MADDQREIPRKSISFSPLIEDIIAGIEAAAKKHLPNGVVVFVDCGECDRLHVHVFDDEESEEERLGCGIMPNDWRLVIKR